MFTSDSDNKIFPISSDTKIKRTNLSDAIKPSPTFLQRLYKENDKYMVTFYYSQAFSALFINFTHLFIGPFSIPILWFIFSKNLIHAMVFSISKDYFTGDFQNWLWVFFTLLIASIFPDGNLGLIVVFVATGSVLFLRQILVSVKYGYYPKKTWEKMLTTEVDRDFIYSNMILRSWVKVPEKIAEIEILASMKRMKIKKKNLILRFSQISSHCQGDLNLNHQNGNNSFDPKVVPSETVAIHLTKQVVESQTFFELTLIKWLGFLYVFSMVFLKYYYFYEKHSDLFNAIEIVYVSYSSYKAFTSSSQFVSFIAAGLYDFKRKKVLMAQCSGLISKNDQKYLLFPNNDRPQLDFNDPDTVLGWYFLRRSFIEFGRRYTLRVFLYASLIFPGCIMIIIILILQLAGVVGVSANFYLIPNLFLAMVVFYVIIHMAITVLSLNRTFSVHRDLLLECISNINNRLENKNLEALKNLEFVIRRLKHDYEVRPITMIGLIIDDGFIIRILIIGLSGVFAVVQLAYTNS